MARLHDPANFAQSDYITATSRYYTWFVVETATHDPGLGGPIGGYLVGTFDYLHEAEDAAGDRLMVTENPRWEPPN